jgi:hypothetical protein
LKIHFRDRGKILSLTSETGALCYNFIKGDDLMIIESGLYKELGLKDLGRLFTIYVKSKLSLESLLYELEFENKEELNFYLIKLEKCGFIIINENYITPTEKLYKIF